MRKDIGAEPGPRSGLQTRGLLMEAGKGEGGKGVAGGGARMHSTGAGRGRAVVIPETKS